MREIHGRDISIYDEPFLEKTLVRRLAFREIEKTSEYCNYLKESSTEAEALYSSLNITYSQFFRTPLTFSVLEQCVLPRLLSQKPDGGEIRVWSAGCSSGQEPYSLAMLLSEMISNQEKTIRFRIFATDTSQTVLDLAKDGVFDREAVQNLKVYQLHSYFSKQGENYVIVPQLRRNIIFSVYDLLDQFSVNPPESIYGDFDIVFCSNLLFYYKLEIQLFILEKIQKSLSATGYLVTGQAERSCVQKATKLQMISVPAAIFTNY